MKRACVYTGASPGTLPAYRDAAVALARELVRSGLEIVCGGGRVGLMGVLADEGLSAGGRVIGVIPEALVAREVGHQGLSEIHVVRSMHERKRLMSDLSDAFIALPGGLGTLDETFEMLSWAQLGFHAKPCGFLNVVGYYDKLLEFLDHCASQRFISPEHRKMVLCETDAMKLLGRFEDYSPPSANKWLDRDLR